MSDQAPPPPPPPEGEPPQGPGYVSQPGQPQYGQPQPGQPEYGQPQYGQPEYGQPQPGQPAYGQPQYGQPQYGGAAPVNTQKATWALVLGILSLVCCGFLTGIPAIILGRNAKAELEAAGQSGSTANVGMILGIIGTALSILGLVFTLVTGTFSASVG